MAKQSDNAARKLRIAQIAPIAERVPPKKYGGTERVIYDLTEELVSRGHEVTLFATGDSKTSARLVSVYPQALRETKMRDIYGAHPFTMLNLGIAYDRQDEFDIIHDHNPHFSLPVATLARTPVVMTMHGPFTVENRLLFQSLRKVPIVTISNAQSYAVPRLNHAGTIHHGLNMEHFPFSATHDGYLLSVGRISREKGTHEAILAAIALNMDLVIAAKLDTIDTGYFREYVEPYLSEKIRWIGEVDEDERNRLMSRARCLVHPVYFREPFGLVMIEAMACGTPVIAFNRGSPGEIIRHGESGFVVEDLEAMIDAIMHVETLSREDCRRYALTNFSAARMADDYEALYREIIAGNIPQKLHGQAFSPMISEKI